MPGATRRANALGISVDQDGPQVLGVPTRRAECLTKADLDAILKEHQSKPIQGPNPLSDEVQVTIWQERKSIQAQLLSIDFQAIPPDALGFYHPFHREPLEEWGIYIVVDELVKYLSYLFNCFPRNWATFNLETLATCILFEVFNHEFFHHLVEVVATDLEIAAASLGVPQALYSDYFQDRYTNVLSAHPHSPLEEALANAYAYNAFGFISRSRTGGCIDFVSQAYRKFMWAAWTQSPPGYRDASVYAGPTRQSTYTSGAAQLAMMLMPHYVVPPEPLLLLASRLLQGHAAYAAKPDIPTYLVGTEQSLSAFYDLLPAPNATYTSLFWARDTTKVDKYLKDQRKKLKTNQ